MMAKLPFDVSQVNDQSDLTEIWPVSIDEYTSIAKNVYLEFSATVRNLSKFEQQILLTDTSSLNLLINFINYDLAAARCASNKVNYSFGNLTRIYRRENFPQIFSQTNKYGWTHWSKSYLKTKFKNFKYGKKGRFYARYRGSDDFPLINKALLYEIKSPLQLDYIKKNANNANFIDFSINSTLERVSKIPPEYSHINDIVSELVNKLMKNAHLAEGEFFLENLSRIWGEKLFKTSLMLVEFQKLFNSETTLFVGGPAKPLSKTLSFACQNAGGQTTAFSHGNEMGLHVECEFTRPFNEFQCYNNFVFSSEKIAQRYKKLASNSLLTLPFRCNYISNNARTYRDLVTKYSSVVSKISKPKIETIMVIGYPMGPYRIWSYENSFFYDALKIELQICKLLKESGYKVLYKAHPDRVGYIEKIMSPIVDQVITNKFEDVMKLADLFVFHYTHTTTFGAALCSQTPITLYTSELHNFDPQDLSLLKKRVSIVEKGLSSSTERLLESIKNPITSFLKKNILELIESE